MNFDIGSYYGVKFSTLGELATTLLHNAYYLAGLLVLFFLIFGGASIIIGAGGEDSKKVARGGRIILGAILGLIVVFLSIFIVKVIEFLTGVSILSPNI